MTTLAMAVSQPVLAETVRSQPAPIDHFRSRD